MLKKILAFGLMATMLFTACFAFAEDTVIAADGDEPIVTNVEDGAEDAEAVPAAESADSLVGDWFMVQYYMEGVGTTVEGTDIEMQLNADGTGTVTRTYANGTTSSIKCSWIKAEDGQYYYKEDLSANVDGTIVVDEDGFLTVDDGASRAIVFSKVKGQYKTFAKQIAAESASDFDGRYAVAYISGTDYFLSIERALNELYSLGVNSTSVNIADGKVELFGEEAREFTYSEEGRLEYITDESDVATLNVYIYKLEDGGIAVNWFGLTFYAYPAD